ncbi:MAG: Uma2 family endonuclease [Acidobacteria bacterium]|nr:Uma2 family endonuclease [Acidobacteriota bacterium]MCI0623403.1 Uma2 family endonuclease [Acidobacteriota bacterium]MCI0722706.1 Uma2 family endonuclease [Acidobacteriota bacterium]
MSPPQIEEPQVHLWTREETYRMEDVGLFQDKRVELLEGRIFEMPPMKTPHATSLLTTEEQLRAVLPPNCHLRSQMPLTLSAFDEPFPDLAVVPGSWRDYPDQHPSFAYLVVEVADTSLAFDRTKKALAYASAGIPEYWIINLLHRVLEVHRVPSENEYSSKQSIPESGTITPLFAPATSISVKDLLP